MQAERALAGWIGRKLGLEPELITNISDSYEYWQGCPTCGDEGVDLTFEFYYDGKYREFEPNMSIIEILQQCLQIASEQS